jgi:hypothetical protein
MNDVSCTPYSGGQPKRDADQVGCSGGSTTVHVLQPSEETEAIAPEVPPEPQATSRRRGRTAISDGGNLMTAEVRWVVGHVAYGSLQVSPGP